MIEKTKKQGAVAVFSDMFPSYGEISDGAYYVSTQFTHAVLVQKYKY
jgi:hypothetical protein